jgi:predicted Fe-Mo cluster-binding NifX family protein
MKIAVSAMGTDLESPVNPRFGRSSGFVVYDTQNRQAQYLDNSANLSLQQGAGIKAAKMIADSGAEVLIAGQLGPKAAQALERAKIRVYHCSSGSVGEAIEQFQANQLKPLSGDQVQAGPGKMGGRGRGGGGRGMGRQR